MKSDVFLCKSIEILSIIIKLKKEVFQCIYNKNIIMRSYFGLGQLSSEEKSNILDQHKSVYNGYQTMQPQVSNTQPLTVYDFAGDKDGMVVNNKGEVKKYTNMGINEQVSKKSMCECGGDMYEGECMECGYKSDMSEGEGKLSDIYNVEDLNSDAGFDYIEGGSNDVDTFEGMHKNLYKEDEYEDDDNEDDGFLDDQLDEDITDNKPYEKGKLGMKASRARASFEPTPKEKDILEKLFGQYGDDIPPIVIRYLRKLPRKVFTKRLEGLGLLDINSLKSKKDVTEQGGNAYDMDVDSIEPAYDFVSGGPDDVYPVNEYETMESAFADDEIDEVDVSGSQGTYSDMEPPYDFDSEGPGKGGPYQEFSFEGKEDEDSDDDYKDRSMYSPYYKDEEDDFGFAKHSGDFDGDDSEDDFGFAKHSGDFDGDDSEEEEWEEIDTDLQEGFKNQKNKIMEMFNRFNKYN